VRRRAGLDADFELRDATMYRLQTLAVSTQRLSSSFKETHPEIPWNDLAGFRNRVVHGYLTIDADIIWDIVVRDVPPLAECARTALELGKGRTVRNATRESTSDTEPRL
jgi:uncharacterized protein with HEPN domain